MFEGVNNLGTIQDIYLMDIEGDGDLDLMVLVGGTSRRFIINFYFQENGKLHQPSEESKKFEISCHRHHPQFFEVFDEQKGRLQTYILVQETEADRVVYSFHRDKDHKLVQKKQPFEDFISKDSKCIPYSKVRDHNIMSDQNGGTFIDLNMDCRPDLLVEGIGQNGRVHEIYFFTDDGFCLVDVNVVPEDLSMVSFLDTDKNGANDAVFLSRNMELYIFMNHYKLDDHDSIGLCKTNDAVKPPFQRYEVKVTEDVVSQKNQNFHQKREIFKNENFLFFHFF